jgi:hypothetical protein
LETTPSDVHAENGDYLVRHIMALKRQSSFRNSIFVVIIEANYGGHVWATSHAARVKDERLSNVKFARRNERGIPAPRPGVFTLKQNKGEMMAKLRKLIEFKGIRFNNYIVSVCIPGKTSEESSQYVVNELLYQILGYRQRFKAVSDDPTKPLSWELSGKFGPAGKDDLVDVVALILFWFKLIIVTD